MKDIKTLRRGDFDYSTGSCPSLSSGEGGGGALVGFWVSSRTCRAVSVRQERKPSAEVHSCTEFRVTDLYNTDEIWDKMYEDWKNDVSQLWSKAILGLRTLRQKWRRSARESRQRAISMRISPGALEMGDVDGLAWWRRRRRRCMSTGGEGR